MSSSTLSPWPPFFQRHSPPQISSLQSPQLSPCSLQQFSPWDCSPVSTFQLPAAVYSGGPVSLSRVCRTMAHIVRDSHSIQTVTDQLLHSLTASFAPFLSQLIVPNVRISPPLQLFHLQVQIWSSSFSFLFFVLPGCEWIYIFSPNGQRLLPVLNWYSVRTSASEDVFLMHPWWGISSMSTYSSNILSPSFPLKYIFILE